MADQKISELTSSTPGDSDNFAIERSALTNWKVSFAALRTWLEGFFLKTTDAEAGYARLAEINTFTGGSQFYDQVSAGDIALAVTHLTRSDNAILSVDGAESYMSIRARNPGNTAGMWSEWHQSQDRFSLQRRDFASGVYDDLDVIEFFPSAGAVMSNAVGGDQGEGSLNAVALYQGGEQVVTLNPQDGELYGRRDLTWEVVPANLSGQPYSYSNNTNTGANPGSGNLRLNTAAWATVTQIAVSELNDTGLNILPFLLAYASGDPLAVRDDADVTRSAIYTLTGDPVDAGGYVQYNVAWVSDQGGPVPTNNSSVHLIAQGQSGGVGQSNLGANVGGEAGEVFRDKTGVTLNFRTLRSSDNSVQFTTEADTLNVTATGAGGGEANRGENVGTGQNVYIGMNGVNLQFKGFLATQFDSTADTISVNAGAFEATGAVVAHEGRVDDPHSAQGYVTGPINAVNNRLAAFDGVTGKLLQDSGSLVTDFDPAGSAAAVQSNLDTHTGNATIHFTEASINHQSITGAGTRTHAEIDSHFGAGGAAHAAFTLNTAGFAPGPAAQGGNTYLRDDGVWATVPGGVTTATFYTTHTYAIPTLADGASTSVPFYADVVAGQVQTLEAATFRLASGSATLEVRLKGVAQSFVSAGGTTLTPGATPARDTLSAVPNLSQLDDLDLNFLTASGATDLTVTLTFQNVVTLA